MRDDGRLSTNYSACAAGTECSSHLSSHVTLIKKKKNFPHIQGADDKLGQFLDQDIEASANHRNVLRHSFESCSSLVSPNLNKLSIFT